MPDSRLPLNEFVAGRGEAQFKVMITQEHPEHGALFDLPRHFGDKVPALDYFVELASEADVRAFCFIQVKSTRAGYTPGGRLKVTVSADEMQKLAKYDVPTYVVGIDDRRNCGYVLSANGESTAGFSRMCTDYPLNPETLAVLHREIAAYWNSPRPAFQSSFVDVRWRENEA